MLSVTRFVSVQWPYRRLHIWCPPTISYVVITEKLHSLKQLYLGMKVLIKIYTREIRKALRIPLGNYGSSQLQCGIYFGLYIILEVWNSINSCNMQMSGSMDVSIIWISLVKQVLAICSFDAISATAGSAQSVHHLQRALSRIRYSL